MFKKYIQSKLERSVKKYFRNHPDVKLVVVTGSVGKTSTKIAIGTVLSQKLRVRLHEWDFNSSISVPLTILGITPPEGRGGLWQWMTVFRAVRERINQPADVDVIVQEIGANESGQITHFGRYIQPDIAVVSGLSPIHLDSFGSIDAIASEQLAVVNYSKAALINRDDIPGQYAESITNPNINTYGTTEVAEYNFVTVDYTVEGGYTGSFSAIDFDKPMSVQLNLAGDHIVRSAVAAGAVAAKFGFSANEIAIGLGKVRAINGCMNVLRGVNGSLIIDDTYDAGPLSSSAALRALYQISAPQKIAVLGSMYSLGEASAEYHEEVGSLCDPAHLAHVITVGEDAEKYLAPAARARGNHVVSFKSALEAGAAAHKYLESGGVILFKGSKKATYLEEAVKIVLLSTDDEKQLVRQTPEWTKKKQDFFSDIS